MSPDETRRKRLDDLQHLLGSMSVPDETDYALNLIVRDLITVVTDADRDHDAVIGGLLRQHEALDKRVEVQIGPVVSDLVRRVAALEDATGTDPQPTLSVSDDDPLDLDACGAGTLLRDRRGDWWLRTSGGWRVIYDESAADGDAPDRQRFGPFTVVHRG